MAQQIMEGWQLSALSPQTGGMQGTEPEWGRACQAWVICAPHPVALQTVLCTTPHPQTLGSLGEGVRRGSR